MTIATAITAAQGRVANAYISVSTKGGTLPATQNLSNLPTAIESIPTSEILFTSTITDGKYNVPNKVFTVKTPQNATSLATSALEYAFDNWKASLIADFSSLTSMPSEGSLRYAFQYSGLTSVNFQNLVSIGGRQALLYAFRETSLTSVSFPSLTSANGNQSIRQTFRNTVSLVTADFPSLSAIGGSAALSYCFYGCTGITDIYFRALTTNSFGSNYTDQFDGMMTNTGSNITHTIHFPSNIESTIQGLTGYPAFGGTPSKVVLAFDLPATS